MSTQIRFRHSRADRPFKMSSSNVASADDFEEQVESTAVPGQQSTKQFPPSERPNACM